MHRISFDAVFSFFDKKIEKFCGKIENKKGNRLVTQNYYIVG